MLNRRRPYKTDALTKLSYGPIEAEGKQRLYKNCGKSPIFRKQSEAAETLSVVVGKYPEELAQSLLRSSSQEDNMTFANYAGGNQKYPDLDRDIGINATMTEKALKRAYNFVMWLFVRDSWMALLPRWCGFVLLALALLRLTGVLE